MNWKKMIAVVACAMTLTSVIAGCGQDTSKEAFFYRNCSLWCN